jgi:hypothetical protein
MRKNLKNNDKESAKENTISAVSGSSDNKIFGKWKENVVVFGTLMPLYGIYNAVVLNDEKYISFFANAENSKRLVRMNGNTIAVCDLYKNNHILEIYSTKSGYKKGKNIFAGLYD